jgi:hypothetical protein
MSTHARAMQALTDCASDTSHTPMGGCAVYAVTNYGSERPRLFYGTTNYVLRAADLGGLYRSTDGSCRRAGPHGPGTTNLLRHRDYGPAATRGISTRPILGRGPEPGHPPGAATLRGSGPEQRIGEPEDSEADGSWRTKGRDPATPCERSL